MAIDLQSPGANLAALNSALASILSDKLPSVTQKNYLAKKRLPAAVGDGVLGTPASGTDDSAALQAILDEAFGVNGNGEADLGNTVYRVTSPITVNIGGNRWGRLAIKGGIIQCAINNTSQDCITLKCTASSNAQVRHLTIQDLVMNGQGGASPVERDGLVLSVDAGGDGAIYAFQLINCNIESFGRHNIRLVGDVFEGQMMGGSVRGAGTDGVNVANGASGIISSLGFIGVNFAQNRGAGLNVVTPVNDVYCLRCDFVQNGSWGCLAVNGLRCAIGCHFENNFDLAASFSLAAFQGGLGCNNFCTVISCYGISNSKQTHLYRGNLINNVTMIDCWMSGSGGAATAELVSISGTNPGRRLTMIGCVGIRPTSYSGAHVFDHGVHRPVPKTSNYTLLDGGDNSERGCCFTNEGATGLVTLTLPTAVAGYEASFDVQDADGIKVLAASGDTIRMDGLVSAAAGFAQSTAIGSTLRIRAINATEWIAESSQGTWTVT